jgi:hypothetical protein
LKVYAGHTDERTTAKDLENLINNSLVVDNTDKGRPILSLELPDNPSKDKVPTGLDIKENKPSGVMGYKDNKSILDMAEDILGTAATGIARVKGAADDITSSTAQALNAFGLSKQANKINKLNRKIDDTLKPIGQVVSTGQGAINATQHLGSTIKGTFGGNKVDANEIAEILRHQ